MNGGISKKTIIELLENLSLWYSLCIQHNKPMFFVFFIILCCFIWEKSHYINMAFLSIIHYYDDCDQMLISNCGHRSTTSFMHDIYHVSNHGNLGYWTEEVFASRGSPSIFSGIDSNLCYYWEWWATVQCTPE